MRNFYFRYYSGFKGKFGHEFEEIDINDEGNIKYLNFTQYKGKNNIYRQLKISKKLLKFFINFLENSNIFNENDDSWPKEDDMGFQELEIYYKNFHICFRLPKSISIKRYIISKNFLGLNQVLESLNKCLRFLYFLLRIHNTIEQDINSNK